MQKEEEVFVELSRQSLRQYKRRKNGFLTSVKKKLPDIAAKAQEYVAGLQSESVSSLAEYVMKRKMILDVFEESLKYVNIDAQISDYEDAVPISFARSNPHQMISITKTITSGS